MALKSLRDSLLEYAVLNMERLVPHFHGCLKDFQGEDKRDDIKDLPPGLFDEILEKSHDMLWEIPAKCLIPFLINRDKVKWRDVSYFTRSAYLEGKDLERIIQRGPPIVSLHLQIQKHSIENADVLKVLDKLSDSLESLTLEASTGNFCLWRNKRNKYKHNTFEGRPILRLKRLVMSGSLLFSQLNLDPLALNMLELSSMMYMTELLTRLEEFQNLTYLSLFDLNEHSHQEKITFSDLLQTVLKLKKLRFLSLNIAFDNYIVTADELCILMSNLAFLEEIEIYELFETSSIIVRPRRKLKLLSVFQTISGGTFSQKLNLLAHRVLILERVECFLDYAEISRSMCKQFYTHLLSGHLNILKAGRTVLTPRMERMILKLSRNNYEIQKTVLHLIKLDFLSQDFLSKLVRVRSSSYHYYFIGDEFESLLEDKFLASLRRRDLLFHEDILINYNRG